MKLETQSLEKETRPKPISKEHSNKHALASDFRQPFITLLQASAMKLKRCSLYWTTPLLVAIPYRRFGTTYPSNPQGSRDLWPLNMGPIGCPKTSVRN
jgi:hypothetical protein